MDIIIKADKKISGRYVATQSLNGRPIIEGLFQIAMKAGFDRIYVYAGDGAQMDLSTFKNAFPFQMIGSLDQSGNAITVEVDAVYHPGRLLRSLKKRARIERSILWRLNNDKDFEYAQILLNKTHFYPIGRYYIVPFAKYLARLFQKFNINANSVTFLCAGVGLLVCAALLSYNDIFVRLSFIGVLVWWLLDHVDGHLARLRYEQSKLGTFLDSFLGSLLLHMMHFALSLGLYFKTGSVLYLIVGIFYMFGNFMFILSNMLAFQLKIQSSDPERRDEAVFKKPTGLKRLISFLDDTDVRIHLLAVSCLFLIPQVSLFYNTIYCNIRWIINLAYRVIRRKI